MNRACACGTHSLASLLRRGPEAVAVLLICKHFGKRTKTTYMPVMHLAGGSPQADIRPGRLPTDFSMETKRKPPRTSTGVPNRNPLQTQGLPTSRIRSREAPHKQNYDQGAYPQTELRPGSLPTSRITTRELAGWMAGWLAELRPGNLSCAWLAGWLAGGLAGWLAESQRGPKRPREAERG